MVLTLYKMDASPPVRAVYMVIEALSIPNVKYVDVDLLAEDHLKEEFLKLNPQHTIPMLTDDKFVIWDSHAIATYLLNKYGKGSSYYPEDPEKRALIEMRLHFDSGILYPALRENDEPIFFWGETTFKPEGLAKIKSAYDFTEKFLSDSPWIAGDDVTVADMSCVATIGSLDALLPINEKEYPKITSWLKRCSELDFYQRGNNVKGLLEFKALLKQYLSRGKE
ncbi:glutathione S-transferase epsilon 1 [Bombyx mori]|uniref:Glutathione S-transferase 1 n=1 Tax=Bombyx mori TaxID=7091 RepID=Q86PP4_BOMMO|nr:glutathione S-transferase epsilon 1 [Bombyx mori]AAO41719.1 glutathione S-transferase 1 [Bombyx mori]ABI15774.1 glutathione S-transferase 1 [Bombyx mori]